MVVTWLILVVEISPGMAPPLRLESCPTIMPQAPGADKTPVSSEPLAGRCGNMILSGEGPQDKLSPCAYPAESRAWTMRKPARSPLESPNFLRKFALIASAGLGLPLTIALLPRALGYGDADLHWGRIAVAMLPTAFCAVTGYFILRFVYWLAPMSEEERGAE